MTKDVNKLTSMLSDIDVEEIYGEDAFWDHLEQLSATIREKLKEVGRRVKS
jgi:hypothetical protein